MAIQKGYIYFLKAQERDLFKIGRTVKNPQRRLKQIATGCPFELDLYRFFESVDSIEAEKNLHKHFKQYRKRGEWFQVSEETVRNYLKGLKDIVDISLENSNFAIFENRFLVLRCTVEADGITITTEKCPFCGKIHRHGTGGVQYARNPGITDGIPNFGHHVSHCDNKDVEILLPNGVRVNNKDGYFLGLY